MCDKSVSNKQRVELLRTAADKHQLLYRDAMNGRGVDRHLFALYVACRGIGYVRKLVFLQGTTDCSIRLFPIYNGRIASS